MHLEGKHAPTDPAEIARLIVMTIRCGGGTKPGLLEKPFLAQHLFRVANAPLLDTPLRNNLMNLARKCMPVVPAGAAPK